MAQLIRILVVSLCLVLYSSNILLGTSFFQKTFINVNKKLEWQLSSSVNTSKAASKLTAQSALQNPNNCDVVTVGPPTAACSGLAGVIGGNVFEDIDYDGDLSATEVGIAGVEVNLYDATNTIIQTTTTDISGNYAFSNLSAVQYRVEFVVPDAISCWAKPSLAGQDGNTTVQFLEPGNCANLGLANPTTYCGANPTLASTCFIDGEPSLGGSSGEGDVLVSYPYNNPTPSDMQKLAFNKEMGTVWGLAYDKSSQSFYTGAMLKRHAGFGPLGIDGIYKTDNSNPSNPIIENWLKLSDLGVDVGTDPRNYSLPAEAGLSNTDPDGFAGVGKVGIGDVDISLDGKTLYAMNLNNNGSLVIIDVETKTLIDEIKVNNPGCETDSDVRPWGIELFEGEVYIGMVCSGQTGTNPYFNFFVLKLDGSAFVEVFSESLDYEKGYVYPKFNAENNVETCGRWESWTDDFSELHSIGINQAGQRICRPQPILSDLEFDKDGSIILAFMDRTGHQTGYNQYNTTTEFELYNGYVGGDILRVHNNNGTFELEQAGTTTAGGGCGPNGEGPNGGEYYCGENYKDLHTENSLGALAISGADDLVALNLMDPVGVFSGGTVWLNNTTGQQESAFELYNSHPFTGPIEVGTFGKAAGLGDLELVCESAPIEIGNLVWIDENKDGIQGAEEEGVDGIEVELVKAGIVIATTTTANGGEYYFNQNGGANQNWFKPEERVLPKMEYTIRIKDDQFLWTKVQAVIPIVGGLEDARRNNDATHNGDYLEIVLTTGKGGEIVHAYDFGVAPSICLGNMVWEDVNNDGLMDIGEAGIPNVSVILCSVGADGQKGTQDDVLIDSMRTDAAGKYLFQDLCAGDYFVKVNTMDLGIMLSSTGTGYDGTQPVTVEPAGDPDDDIDNNDDGTQMAHIVMSSVVTLSVDGEPTNDADTDPNSNTTIDFGLFKPLSLGNKVWVDKDNNGLLDATERGVNGVEVTLFQPGPDGLKGTADDPQVATLMTDLNGCYNFDMLYPGQYWIKLTNGIPNGLVSSDGNGMNYTGDGIYEQGVDPDIVVNDTDDNGSQMGTMIMSEVIDLFVNDEPTNFDGKNNTNMTVDFALFPINEIRLFDPCNCLGNASSPTANDGQFTDKIVILSATSGETWTLKSATNLFSLASSAPPAAPSAMPLGTVAIENGTENGMYRYELPVLHVDGVGYSACFTNGTNELNIANQCKEDQSCVKNVVASPDATPTVSEDPCAQHYIMGADGVVRADTIKCCDDRTTFSDDGTVDGNYADDKARTDVYTICAPDQWKTIKYNFKKFDVAAGDTLYVYDGKTDAAPLIGKFSGIGVSQTGGWVSSNCDPYFNNSACLTFVFKTNNDNIKAEGWTGNFECSERDIKLARPDDFNAVLDCAESFKAFTFRPATVTAACGTVLDTQSIKIFNAHGVVCVDTCIGGTEAFVEMFGLGNYSVEYQLKSDSTKVTMASISVQAPSLVCNDRVTIPLGSACSIQLTPDDLLENPCDVNGGTLNYYLKIKGTDKNGNEEIIAEGGGANGTYPLLTKDMIDACGGSFKVEVEQRYYENTVLNFCNNGQKQQSCETTVDIIDQSVPVFEGLTTIDTFKLCTEDLTPEALGISAPKAVDNCSEAEVTFTDITILSDGGVCDTTRAEINWTATDACGNIATATQSIVLLRPTLAEVVLAKNIVLSCGVDTEADLTNLSKTGVPGIKVGKVVNGILIPSDTLKLSTIDYVCGFILQQKDVKITADCGIKIYREWSILDWCNAASPTALQTQLVELKDLTAPTFVNNTLPTRTLNLPHSACTYDITKLENPAATDNCSEVTVSMDAVFRIEDGERWLVETAEMTALDLDSFLVRWIAADACHSLSRPVGEQLINDTVTQLILIEDNNKPSAICVDKINLSLGQETARLHYSAIDGGSYDGCGIAKYELSRDEVNWDTIVEFGCEDAHQQTIVHLRVTDNNGNQSSCWMEVKIEDKIAPICSPLADQKGNCEDAHVGELGASTDANDNGKLDDAWVDMSAAQIELFNQAYGNPHCSDNVDCGALMIQQQYQLVNKNCGVTNIQRRYRAIDWDGEGLASNWEIQNINLETKTDWTVTLPTDWKGQSRCIGTGSGDAIPNSAAFVTNGSCSMFASEMDEKVFVTTDDACLKVVRTFTFINWCTYQAGAPTVTIPREENEHGMVAHPRIISASDYEGVSRLQYIQILKIQDNTAPEVIVKEVDNCINSVDDCKELKRFEVTATDCNDFATAALNYNWTLSKDGQQLATGTDSFFEYSVSANTSYEVVWKVSDNCGNTTKKEQAYAFIDCKKPAPYCLHGTAVEMMSTGMIQIWATDIERNSTDNCTTEGKLEFKIWHGSLGSAPTDLAGVKNLPESVTLNCVYAGEQTLGLYVIDEAGNWDFCTTYVLVQDNMNACADLTSPDGMAIVSGTISDWKKNRVAGVMVQTNRDIVTTAQFMTNETGGYTFDLERTHDYTISPEKNTAPLNGVSTFDLVLISKHILGINQFDSPYKYIAADVNKSGTVTAFDMVQLRQLILNIITEFPNNESWRFIDANHVFTSGNPITENFDEFYTINTLSGDMVNLDFVGVKIGDVNGNAQANNLLETESRNTKSTFTITASDRFVEAGETVNVAFAAVDIATTEGYQFTMNYNGQKGTVIEGIAKAINFNTALANKGVFTTSWNGQPTASEVLFTLRFNATASGLLSELVTISSEVTPAEAYNTAGELLDVNLEFTTTADEFALTQNMPNPFKAETIIGFNLPTPGNATLTIMDAQGKVVKTISADYAKGANTVVLKANELEATGILYYQLESADNVATKKMIRIE